MPAIYALTRGLAAACLVLAAISPAAADHGDDFTVHGHIVAGSPTSLALPGASEVLATEVLAACDEATATDGVDGDFVELPDGADGHPARVDFTSAAPADLAVYFYDANCIYMGSEDGGLRSAGLDEPEVGHIPEFARYATVNGFLGTNIDFDFTVFLSKPSVLPDLGTPIPLGRMELFEVQVQPQDDAPVTLRGHVYLPEGAGPFATVLEFSPYWNWTYGPSDKKAVERGGRTTIKGDLRRFLEAGFAVAYVNVRGSGISDGCLDWFGEIDRADAYTVIESLAGKLWSNGSVGMYGHSYPGGMAYAGMASGAPSLKAIIPMSPVIDLWSYFSVRGAPYFPQYPNVFWKPVFGAAAAAEGTDPLATTRPACGSTRDEIEQHAPLWNGDRNPYYLERDLRPLIEDSPVAVFATTGLRFWTSIGAGEAAGVTATEDLWRLLDGRARVMVGQWGHDLPVGRPDFAKMSLSWFDHYLRGGPLTVAPGIAEYQDDQGEWHATTTWPPPETQTLFLSSGTLAAAPGATQATFVGAGPPCMRVCAFDQTIDACVPNHAAYSTASFAEDVRIAGEFTLDLRLSSTLPDGNLVAYLIESDTGECGDTSARIVARAATDLRHVRTEAGESFPVGVPTEVSLRSMPFGTTLHAGKTLTLAIGGDGDEFRLNPDTYRPAVTITAGRLHLPVA